MGFCGCSLAASTVTAVVLGLVESIFGLSWNILVIVLMSYDPSNETSVVENDNSTEESFYHSEDNVTDLWTTLSDNIKSKKAVEEHMFEIVIAALVLNAIWLITTLALAVGNAEKCRDMLKPWIGVTIIVTVTDIAATIFYIFKAVKDDEIDDVGTAFFTHIHVFYAFMFSRGGPILWIINVALCVFVAQRVKEIEVGKNKRLPFGSDFHINPYSLSPPYDAFETQSSNHTSKTLRPHTPPPDYEGPNGKKRRPSLSSEPETTTLPLSSAGSKGSLARRPLSQSSYLYDDRVELQHRASCAAETVLHHAYVNKGLVMESEGWMGIPRPTLKTNHS
ncbi:uncharacterized protein [Parasteatoda tepidariorum]|uniref:uncharacterized protein n=1 Tax=Parasteatoda tepidariorum TaxID=114398 RepID=UPI00077F8611|nr:uncharacterized protein LOC107455185 [Parasteatoda tepidariorum]